METHSFGKLIPASLKCFEGQLMKSLARESTEHISILGFQGVICTRPAAEEQSIQKKGSAAAASALK